jgi:hypothetical protein
MGAHFLRPNLLAHFHVQPQYVPEKRERGLQIADRDPHVIEYRFHL